MSEGWCGRGDLNSYGIATASPSSWCVCQFRHFRVGFIEDYDLKVPLSVYGGSCEATTGRGGFKQALSRRWPRGANLSSCLAEWARTCQLRKPHVNGGRKSLPCWRSCKRTPSHSRKEAKIRESRQAGSTAFPISSQRWSSRPSTTHRPFRHMRESCSLRAPGRVGQVRYSANSLKRPASGKPSTMNSDSD